MFAFVRNVERCASVVRHHPRLNSQAWLWDAVRPQYERFLALSDRTGLSRTVNGTDHLRILPEVRGISEIYEPDLWAEIMQWVRPGDVVVDAGANIGLYTLAFAHRVGDRGRIIAFEPDPKTFSILRRHVQLNRAWNRVELHQCAVSDRDGVVAFDARGELESRIPPDGVDGTVTVPAVALDTILAGRRIDLLKIDVEGFELHVLRGIRQVLADPERAPRAIFLEAHSYLWDEMGVSDTALLGLLHGAGYRTVNIHGEPIQNISRYMEVIGLRDMDSRVANTFREMS